MKVIVNSKDVSQVVNKIVWSGSDITASRKLEVDIAYKKHDYYFNMLGISIHEGDIILLKDDKDNLLFRGIIIDLSYSRSNSLINYTAFDFMFYVKGSDINGVYDATAEDITKDVCKKLDISSGDIASTGIKQYQAYIPENAYKAIVNAYLYAGIKNGKKYMVQMNDDKLEVIEKGQPSGIILDENYNLIDASYKISLSKLVNKVLVINKTGKVIDEIKDTNSIKKYGTITKMVTDDKEKAKDMLHLVDKTITVAGLNDIRALSGKSLLFRDGESGSDFKFYIKSDSHVFTDCGGTMSLEISMEG